MNPHLTALQAALATSYRIDRELGAGGMATVYLAHDIKHDRAVAIKVLKPELAASIGSERFLKEIRTTANLQHPHIVPLYDSGDASGALFYVMPLLQGESLADRMERDGQLPIEDTIRITRQIAGALDYAHRNGVIHRDIKPDNILLHDDEVLVADFGIAVGAREASGARLTGTGFSLGTPQYMSPEQAVGERNIDARSDIYSLGAVTYEMLTGESPVHARTAQGMVARLLTETPKSLRELRGDVPETVDVAVMRALAKQPDERFASARAFADALTTNMPATPSSPKKKTSVGAKQSRARMIGVSALAATVLAATGIAIFSKNAEARGWESIAVLPLENVSRDSAGKPDAEQDYFAEGMTDELTSNLATIRTLRVTSRGSAMAFAAFKSRPSPDSIGKILNVDAIVEGKVQRFGRDSVRISPTVTDVRRGKKQCDHSTYANTF